jgi:HEAT repeat protein
MFDFLKPDVNRLSQKKDVKGLLKALGYKKEPSIRAQAASALGSLKDTAALEPLLEALKDSSMDVRAAAAEALGNMGDERIAVPLLLVIKNHDYIYPDQKKVRESAFNALGGITAIGSGTTAEIFKIIKGLDYTSTKAAAMLLGKASDEDSVNMLIGIFNDNDNDNGILAAEVLADRGAVKAVGLMAYGLVNRKIPPEMKKAIIRSIGKLKGKDALPQLITTAKYGHEYMKDVIDAFVAIGDAGAVETLLGMLDSSYEDVKNKADQALERLIPLAEAGMQARYAIRRKKWDDVAALGGAALDPLRKALISPAAGDMKDIIKTLGKLGDGKAAETLMLFTAGVDQEIRSEALSSLDQIIHLSPPSLQAHHAVLKRNWDRAASYGSDAIEPLIKALRDDDTYGEAFGTLERIGALSDRAVFRRCLAAGKKWDELAAEGPAALEALYEAAKEGYQYDRVIDTLSRIAGSDIGILAQGLEKEAKVKVAAARALARIGSDAAVMKLNEMAGREHYLPVKRDLVEALGELSSPLSIDVLQNTMQSCGSFGPGNAEAYEIRIAAAKILSRIDDPRAVEILIYELTSGVQPKEVRKGIIRIMGSMSNADVMEPLQRLSSDIDYERDSDISSAARSALYNLQQRDDDEMRAQTAVMKKDWAKALSMGKAALKPLKKALRHHDGQVRFEAAQTLEKIAVPDDPEEYAWYVMAKRDLSALMAQGGRAALPLFHAFNCPKNGIPIGECARAIGRLGDLRAIPHLKDTATYSDDELASGSAFEALKMLGAPSVQTLVELLKGSRKRTRQGAARALSSLYHGKELGDKEKLLILSLKGEMEKKHSDGSWSSDCGGHNDTGTGVML